MILIKSRKRSGASVTALAYDALDRLVQADKDGQVAQYAYDHAGRRIKKTVNGTTVNYHYNGPDIHAEYGSWGKASASYVHGPATDDPLLRVTAANGASYLHADGLGSIVAASDATSRLTAAQLYDAWGQPHPTARLGSLGQYGYTGREPDETGLIYYRARYYDPGIGRFTQRDPIGLKGGLNLYSYVRNNPVNLVAPSGLRDFLMHGTDISGKMDQSWWQPGSPFADALGAVTQDIQRALPWNGGNTDANRRQAAQLIADQINQVPRDEPVRVACHSHGCNVLALASPLLTRPVELVVAMGQPVRPDYEFDMANIKQQIRARPRFPKVGAGGTAQKEEEGRLEQQ